MAKPGFISHPKFRRLVYILNVPVPHALGYVECMWGVCYDRGDPLLGDTIDVELAAQWPGEKGELFKALLECRFIDQIDHDRYQVHDLLQNCPDYVRKRMERERTRKHAYAHRQRPFTAAWRSEADDANQNGELGGQRPPNCDDNQTLADLGSPPSPAQPALPAADGSKAANDRRFATFWTAYPRKDKKVDSRKAFGRLKVDDALLAVMLAALERFRSSDDWMKDGGRFIPHPTAWLNGRRWEDESVLSNGSAAAPAETAEQRATRKKAEEEERERRRARASVAPSIREIRTESKERTPQ
jgi:hypothetical protein